MMLYKLVSQHDRALVEPEVICLQPNGAMGVRIAALGIGVRSLDLRTPAGSIAAIGKLSRWLRELRPDIVQTWMYHGDLFGGVAARLARCRNIAWNIRNSTLDPAQTGRSTLQIVKILARLSRTIPARIVCCSENARLIHAEIGYDSGKMVVVPNGFDLDLFSPDPVAYRAVRAELGIENDSVLIGLMARYHPQKDHRTFFASAARLHAVLPDVHFLLCGTDVDRSNSDLMALVAQAGAHERFHLLGKRDDMPRLTAALDIAVCSSSFGEAFPNVLGEAMACGVPCATTDVGDAAYIVGDTGRVVPTKSPERLAEAMQELASAPVSERARLGAAARRRVQDHFDLPTVARRYEQLYREIGEPCIA